MSQVRRPQHPNAALTPAHRLKMVRLVVEEGWSVPAVAQRFQVDDKTVRKWCDRYRAEGAAGLEDRSSRPRHSPNRTPEPLRRRVVELRRHSRRGAGFIAYATGMHASTVHRICVAEGLGRLDRGDRSTGPPTKPLRYERETPGEMLHVDVKKLPSDPRRRRLAHPRTRQRRTPPTRGMALRPLRHRRPHPAGLLRDPHQRDRRHRRQGSGYGPRPSTPSAGSPARGSSPTTAPATAPATSPRPSKTPAPAPDAPAPTGPKPTAKSSVSTASSTRNGPTPATGPQTPNDATPTSASCTTTMSTGPHGALGWDTPMATLTRLNGDNVLGMHT